MSVTETVRLSYVSSCKCLMVSTLQTRDQCRLSRCQQFKGKSLTYTSQISQTESYMKVVLVGGSRTFHSGSRLRFQE